ncbi:tryptophan 2,3-dioxygenase [Nitrospirillum amazonense]|uniref:Tryptophan 2,3-dioxygenase n=1 Tax=Nitrospirillum amazonense TaxID=28077 RepID=A0A560ESP5_9PROT|nr:tryptophan 2,3-dioxygenase family protein [Nitrospirillum amazonense]TWB12399.1 tryptophan 2,3-dioxygenase [Nitrospirillum amazonense]
MTPPLIAKAFVPPPRVDYARYLRLEELLSLQRPLTAETDERLFIIIHQMAELGFALLLGDLSGLAATPSGAVVWPTALGRLVALVKLQVGLVNTLAATIDRAQFLAFRQALAPASGFQSAQYRKIELLSANLWDLAAPERQAHVGPATPFPVLFDSLYWRHAPLAESSGTDNSGTDPGTEGSALLDFENAHLTELRALAEASTRTNLAAKYAATCEGVRADPAVTGLLRDYDRLFNQAWPAAHFRLAEKLLSGGPPGEGGEQDRGTGGTAWRRYLGQGRRQRCFFPDLRVTAGDGPSSEGEDLE